MKISLRHIGGRSYTVPSSIIELEVQTGNTTIVQEVTNLRSEVDQEFIQSLRDVADELEEQNKLIKELYK